MKFILSLLFSSGLLISTMSHAQIRPFYETYSWDQSPKYEVINHNDEGQIVLKNKLVTEFIFQGEDDLAEYYLEHKTYWLNSDESIESYNKVYIPYGRSSEIILSKARVIQTDGTVIELDDSKILDAVDEETGRKYKYFAFEGIEKGSIIDYYYVLKEDPNYRGARITLQSSHIQENVSFDLYTPANLVFGVKSYNGLPELVKDTLTEGKLHWGLGNLSLKGLEEEETSAYDASKKYLIYKLDKNLINNRVDISAHSGFVKRLYNFYYEPYDKKTQKLIKEYIAKNLKIKDSEEQSIRDLDNYIKTNVYLSNTNGQEVSGLEGVTKNNVSNQTGLLNLYIALFRTLGIDHEMVITSNRQDIKFDKDFESSNFLTDFMFYFPKYKTYLSPHDYDTRYGFPPAYLTDNYGLFLKEVTIGDFKSGIGKTKYIEALGADQNSDNMIIDVTFNKGDLTKSKVTLSRAMTGYYAMYIQPFMFAIKDEQKEELAKGFAQSINESVEIEDYKLVNDDPSQFGIKPFEINVTFNSSSFVEKAGKKFLFKLGELIGPQMQIYSEKNRVLAVESEFNRSYYRTINVVIPEGYKIANLDDINLQNAYSQNGMEYFSFHSYYEIDGNRLKITADEFYRKNIVGPELYEEYRKVINSAADFNKITLVLEPM